MSDQTKVLTEKFSSNLANPTVHIKITDSQTSPKKNDNYHNRALTFLTNIVTGASKVPEKKNQLLEPLKLVPSSSVFLQSRTRNQEEDVEICKIQAWVTLGVIKKSYSHCLNTHNFNIPYGRTLIDVSEYPGRIYSGSGKDKLNNEFCALHSHLESKLTLSKLSNLREDLIFGVWQECNFDIVTLAVGFTLFDRLLDMNLVNKINRKLYAAVCVLIAFKFIEETHLEEVKEKKNELMKKFYHMDKRDLLTSQLILEAEFSVYAYLNFSVHLEFEEFKGNLEYIKNRLSI